MQPEGLKEMHNTIAFYKENTAILRKCFMDMGFSVYGGDNAPYIWVGFPGKKSWDVFAEILEKCNIVTTPGSGFGTAGAPRGSGRAEQGRGWPAAAAPSPTPTPGANKQLRQR